MTLSKSSALRLVCSDGWSNQNEVSVIRQAIMTSTHQVSDLEAWCRQRDMLTEVSEEDHQESRLSVIG